MLASLMQHTTARVMRWIMCIVTKDLKVLPRCQARLAHQAVDSLTSRGNVE